MPRLATALLARRRPSQLSLPAAHRASTVLVKQNKSASYVYAMPDERMMTGTPFGRTYADVIEVFGVRMVSRETGGKEAFDVFTFLTHNSQIKIERPAGSEIYQVYSLPEAVAAIR